ncbi:hypothetical protein PO124_11695 [Bacillus licheniformis]|nr:hypothetical protein [Bacillus licheniformis]
MIRRLGGSLEEQIAGLLHDVSHTAFPMWLMMYLTWKTKITMNRCFGNGSSNLISPGYCIHTDSMMKTSYMTSKMDAAGAAGSFIMCGSHRLHASRLFSLWIWRSDRDWTILETGLTVAEGEICCTSAEHAEWFARLYYQEVIDFFMNPLNIYALCTLSQMLKEALDMRVIAGRDFSKPTRNCLRC